jgi:predicted RNase H-like HicB family nuclease
VSAKTIKFVTMEYLVIFEQDEDGVWVASVPDLKGCNTQGDTLDEAKANIKEAMELYLSVLADEKLPIPEPTAIATKINIAA